MAIAYSRKLNIGCVLSVLLGGIGGIGGLYVSHKAFIFHGGKILDPDLEFVNIVGSSEMWQWFAWCAVPFFILSVLAKFLLRNIGLNQSSFNKRLSGIISAFVLMQVFYLVFGCFVGSWGLTFVYGGMVAAPIFNVIILLFGYALGYALSGIYFIIRDGLV